jgi:hypothetical protein
LAASLCTSGIGCDDEKKPDVGVEAKKTEEVAPSGPIEDLEAPAAVVLYGGSDSLVSLAKKAGAMAGPVGAATINGPLIGKGLAQSLGLKNESALDLEKPFRFAVVDPKKLDEPMVLLVTMTKKEELTGLLPPKTTKDDGGNAISYATQGKTIYLNFLDDFAVFTQDKETFAKHKAFLAKLAGAKVTGEGSAVVSVANASKIYESELADAVKKAEQAMQQQSAGMPMGGDGMKKMAQWVASTAKEMDKVVARVDGVDDGGTITFDVLPKEGSDLKKTFDSLGKQKLELLDELPADAPLAMVMAIDPDEGGELTQSLTAWSLQLSLGEDIDEKYLDAMDQYFKATTGQMAFAAHHVPGVEGLRFSGIMGVRDAEKARESQKTLRELYDKESFKKTYDDLGMKMTFKPNAYKVGDVPVDRVEAKLDETGGQANLKQALGPSAALFGDLMNTHVALTTPLGVMAYGQDGKAVIEAWLGGEMAGGFDKDPGVARALKHAAPGTFMLMYAEPLKMMSAMGMPAPPQQGAPTSKSGLAVTAGADEGQLHVVLDLPTAQVAALIGAAMQMQRGMGAPGMGAPSGPQGL